MTDIDGHSGRSISPLLLGSLTLLLTLSGCATVQQDFNSDTDTTQENTAVVATADDDKPEVPLRPLEPETLFDLLVADMAGARQQYGLQLNRYYKQAFATRDAGLAAHATWLAVQLKAAPQALQLAQLWVSLQPESTDANRIAAHYLAYSKQLIKALPHALTALQKDDSEAIHTLERLLKDSDEEQRRQLQDALLSLTSSGQYAALADHPQVILINANILRMQGNYQQAIEQASRIQQPKTNRESALLLIAQATLQRDGLDATLASLEQSLLEIPDSKRLRLQLARQWSEKDIERSRSELNKLVEQFPDDHRLNYSLAMINAQMGALDKAIELLQKLTGIAEHRDNAYFQLGQLLEKKNNSEQAITHYQQVKGGEHYSVAIAAQVRLFAATDRNDELQALIKQLLAQQPDNAVNIYLTAVGILADSQQLPQALVLLNQAMAEFPDNTPLTYNRALIHEQSGDAVAAHQDFRAIIAREPNNAEALNALGYSLTNNSTRYQEAYQLINKAAELEPDNAAILDSLGWALFRLQRHNEALPHLRRAFELFPDPEVAAHLGEVLWAMGNRKDALDIWQKSLDDNPTSHHVTQTMERLGASKIEPTNKSKPQLSHTSPL